MSERVFLKINDVCRQTALGRTTVYALVAAGKFPQMIKLGPRASAWPSDAVQKWIDDRVAEAGTAAAAAHKAGKGGRAEG